MHVLFLANQPGPCDGDKGDGTHARWTDKLPPIYEKLMLFSKLLQHCRHL